MRSQTNNEGRARLRARRWLAAIVAAAATALLGPALVAPATGVAQGPDEHYMLEQFDAGVYDRSDNFVTQAGGHPDIASTYFLLQRTNINPSLPESGTPVATLRDVEIDLPPGLVVNPQATEQCTRAEFWFHECPPASQVGKSRLPFLAGTNNPVFNMVPRQGLPAEFAFAASNGLATASVYLGGHVTSDGQIKMRIANNSAAVAITFSEFEFFGIPADPANGTGATGNPRALVTNPTSCTGPVETIIRTNAWSNSAWDTMSAPAPAGTGCELLPFTPRAEVSAGSHVADSPTPLSVDIEVDQGALTEPNMKPQAHLKKVEVALPDGMAVNPSAANGLKACSPEQIGLGNDNPARCPDASKLGTVEIETPLLKETLNGPVYLAEQNNNPFNELLALYLVPQNKERGVELKLPGKVEADPQTGQLTATFDDNPQLPFSKLSVDFFGGQNAALVNPPTCGTKTVTTEMSPWSAADPDNPTAGEIAVSTSKFEITQAPNGHPCAATEAQRPFHPSLNAAGLASADAGSSSQFVLDLSRHDGDQVFDRLTMRTPEGLSAVLKGTAECTDPQIAASSCPATSKIGRTLVSAGAGTSPYWVRDGQVFLAGPYKGAPLSLLIQVPAVAGPFDLGMVDVRAAVHVNPRTAQLTIAADPMPKILEGIPLRVKQLRVLVDKPGFMQAPTGCEPKSVAARVWGGAGAAVDLAKRFQVGNCDSLGFGPKMKIDFGKAKKNTKRNVHPPLNANLSFSEGDANVSSVEVTLPKGVFLDQARLGRICSRANYAAETCPEESRVGYAKATTPLLEGPVEGPVYLKASDNPLPDLAADLNGQIDIDLFGKIDQKENKKGVAQIRNTFDVVPDVRVSDFELKLEGGDEGLLVNSQNICKNKQSQRLGIEIAGHNGAAVSERPLVGSACKKINSKKAKKLKKKAKKLKRKANRAGSKKKAKQLKKKARKLTKRARKLS